MITGARYAPDGLINLFCALTSRLTRCQLELPKKGCKVVSTINYSNKYGLKRRFLILKLNPHLPNLIANLL